MFRKLVLFLPLVALLVAAGCGDSSDDGATRERDGAPADVVGEAGPDGIYGTDDDVVVGDTPDTGDSVDDSVSNDPDIDVISDDGDDAVFDDGGSLGADSLLGALDPFAMLGGFGAAPGSLEDVDPDLRAPLLTLDDVPAGFEDMGEFSSSVPTELGQMEMAMTMFGRGVTDDDFGAMIMSAAMSLPPEALEEFEELDGLSEAELAELAGLSGEAGMEFIDFRLLDAGGLGDGGFGMHMEMDFAALFSVFGAPEEDSGPTGIAMDMYLFIAGERALMTVVMWPTGEAPGADALALAELMESRA